jgi:hypothetical protein
MIEFAVIGTLAVAGILTALSVFIFLCFLDIRRVAGYHLWFDALFSIALVIVYAGTFSGMVTAFFGGLTLSILLVAVKYLFGYWKWYRRWGWRFFRGVFDV